MKITKKIFFKLKQLDRIELRQRFALIEKKYEGSIFFPIFKILIFVLAFLCLLIPQLYLVLGKRGLIALLNDFGVIFSIIYVLLFIGVIIDIALYFLEKKEMKELEDEYFKTEIKK